MTELTPELLAQLEFLVDAGENFPLPLQSVTVRALVAAAKERDQLQRQVGGSSLGAMRRAVSCGSQGLAEIEVHDLGGQNGSSATTQVADMSS
jgi:hypothetical protein